MADKSNLGAPPVVARFGPLPKPENEPGNPLSSKSGRIDKRKHKSTERSGATAKQFNVWLREELWDEIDALAKRTKIGKGRLVEDFYQAYKAAQDDPKNPGRSYVLMLLGKLDKLAADLSRTMGRRITPENLLSGFVVQGIRAHHLDPAKYGLKELSKSASKEG